MVMAGTKAQDSQSSISINNDDVVYAKHLYYNHNVPELAEYAIQRQEGELSKDGALMVKTGVHTGRSPQDKFFVKTPDIENNIWWGNNAAMDVKSFTQLKEDMLAHIKSRELFVQNLQACADENYRINIRVVTEYAWHALFIRHLLRVPNDDAFDADYTIINVPSFKANPDKHGCRSETVIAINMAEKIILIGGTEYAGEIKKSVFTLLNYLLPEQGVMPMHCSANHALDNADETAIFFGLSGTGKTTLSADPRRMLIGDDEHGWSDNGVFNIEGGCYAKTINLSATAEPEIYAATKMFGTLIENSLYVDDYSRKPDFKNATLTQNMRCAYPLHYIPNTCKSAMGGHPKHIIMLTCDAYGVLPPLARLTPEQAIYHFLNGFTAKVAGTERGITEPQPTFSTCFGAPFMPRHPSVYGDLLRQKISKHGSQCWLVNTGWTGGAYGVGKRIPIHITRALLDVILDGTANQASFRQDDNFGFNVPIAIKHVPNDVLNPRETWADMDAYNTQARKLVAMFEENFKKYQ